MNRKKRRRTIPATELRVHLGDALRALDREDLVIEKGGVPVARLVRYEGGEEDEMTAAGAYERALTKRAEPGAWARARAAMERGWAGISAEELEAEIYRRREEGASAEYRSLDEAEDDGGELPDRQRRLHPRPAPRKRVAEDPDRGYQA